MIIIDKITSIMNTSVAVGSKYIEPGSLIPTRMYVKTHHQFSYLIRINADGYCDFFLTLLSIVTAKIVL